MTVNRRAQILGFLKAEVALQKRYRDLLVEERAALITCNREKFSGLQKAFDTLGEDMERQALLRYGVKELLRGGIERASCDWSTADKLKAQEFAARLVILVDEVRQQAEQNRILVGTELRFVDFELTLIMDALKGSRSRQSPRPAFTPRLADRSA